MSKATVVPDFPFDEFQICTFQQWKHKEVIYVALSLAYGMLFLLSTVRLPTSNPFCVIDSLALLIIVYSAKRYGGLSRDGGVPSLLDKILQDSTTYFLFLSTAHLLLLFFEVFAPVSDHHVDLRSVAHDN